ncbi:MAG: hypothetical protein PHS81_02350 [Candidatus Nanoarchaeia archaeon]|nr:hypothetical protein [Candidatus Nanoarchaeia archaeon]
MAKKDGLKKALFSDNVSDLFMDGAKITLLVMIVSIITMWLVAIFTLQIATINMGLIIIVSTGIAISFGTLKVYDATMMKLRK